MNPLETLIKKRLEIVEEHKRVLLFVYPGGRGADDRRKKVLDWNEDQQKNVDKLYALIKEYDKTISILKELNQHE